MHEIATGPQRIGQDRAVSDTPASRPSPSVSVPASREDVSEAATSTASRLGWDRDADSYQYEHGEFLGGSTGARFIWCPEGLDEAEVGLLGPVTGRRVLEVGCGAAQCARWLRTQGAEVVGLDLSTAQLRHAQALSARSGIAVPLVEADATALPLASASFDLAASAFGAIPFIGDLSTVFDEVARVLRPGGRWVFSVSHPVRWAFPDDGGPAGLTVTGSYFDRRAYVERDSAGVPIYVEHHHTIGDYLRALVGSEFRIVDLIEPEWPVGHDRSWDGWTSLRGQAIPGTAIFAAQVGK